MLGWSNEDNMAASAGKPFTQPDTLCVDPKTVSMINSDIVSFLQNISEFVKTVRVDNLHISTSTTYKQLA